MACLIGAPSVRGNSSHQVSWSAYETRHFKIVFHDDVRPQADLARDFLEEAFTRIGRDLGVRDRDIAITVVLTGLPDESNGFSTPLGHRIIIFTRPGQVIASGEIAWMKRVLAHELTHQLTFLALRKSFLGIYSELYKTSHLPAWFLEGLAQYEAESWDAKRNTFFAHVLYNSALEPYPDLATYTKEDPVTGRLVYEQGHAFIRFLAQRQGPGFLAALLRRIRVIPVWSEFKELLSPLTRSYLPLEDAIGDKTGSGIVPLYREFLDSMRTGLKGVPDTLPAPLRGGVPGFAVVYQIKAADSSGFFFTGQRKWDQPYVSLFQSRGGKVEKIGPDFVNPVFDLSPDGNRLLYVRTYGNPDGDLVEKLFLLDRSAGTDAFLSDGASHPVFLGNDSIAFSHFRAGRQVLELCSIANGAAACSEAPGPGLDGFSALSRSSRGILCNALDSAGRTGTYEYRRGEGFVRLFQDTVPAEFPVEAADGTIWTLRDRGGLLQVDAWDPATGAFAPVARYPLGTFYLHRSAPGVIASVVQTGNPGQWNLAPVQARRTLPYRAVDSAMTAVADSSRTVPLTASVDTARTYRAPGFLSGRPPAFTDPAPPIRHATLHPYNSVLEMRPLLAWPAILPDFPSIAPGAGVLLEDPLQQHTLNLTATLFVEGLGYDVSYANRQTPVEMTLAASNLYQSVDDFPPEGPWTRLYMVERIARYSLMLLAPLPADIPLPHGFYLGAKGEERVYRDELAGESIYDGVKILDGWSLTHQDFLADGFAGYSYMRPYSYNYVHPLLATDLEAGAGTVLPDGSPMAFWYGRQTVPLVSELTYTLRYRGEWQDQLYHMHTARLSDGSSAYYSSGHTRGYYQDVYTGLDFPLYKGYIAELPVFGPWNYAGAAFYGGYTREAYEEEPGRPGSGILREASVAGAKLSLLCFPLRHAPLVVSPAVQWDFLGERIQYRLRVEFAGISDSYNLFGARRAEPGSGKHSPL